MQYWLVFIFPSTQIRNRPKILLTNDATLEELILMPSKRPGLGLDTCTYHSHATPVSRHRCVTIQSTAVTTAIKAAGSLVDVTNSSN